MSSLLALALLIALASSQSDLDISCPLSNKLTERRLKPKYQYDQGDYGAFQGIAQKNTKLPLVALPDHLTFSQDSFEISRGIGPQRKRLIRDTDDSIDMVRLRNTRSLDLGSSLMKLERIADNPPGAAEQRQFEAQTNARASAAAIRSQQQNQPDVDARGADPYTQEDASQPQQYSAVYSEEDNHVAEKSSPTSDQYSAEEGSLLYPQESKQRQYNGPEYELEEVEESGRRDYRDDGSYAGRLAKRSLFSGGFGLDNSFGISQGLGHLKTFSTDHGASFQAPAASVPSRQLQEVPETEYQTAPPVPKVPVDQLSSPVSGSGRFVPTELQTAADQPSEFGRSGLSPIDAQAQTPYYAAIPYRQTPTTAISDTDFQRQFGDQQQQSYSPSFDGQIAPTKWYPKQLQQPQEVDFTGELPIGRRLPPMPLKDVSFIGKDTFDQSFNHLPQEKTFGLDDAPYAPYKQDGPQFVSGNSAYDVPSQQSLGRKEDLEQAPQGLRQVGNW